MLSLDHIIVTGKNIESTREHDSRNLAVKLIKGGEHENWGTFNYVAHFSNNCYIESLGVRDEAIARKLDHPLIQHLMHVLDQGEKGPFQFALRTDKMDEYINHFKQHHIPFTGPFAGSRRKPSGKLLSWRMLFPTYDFTNGHTLPFLIEWDQPEHERVDVGLANHQAITSVNYSGTTKEKFTEIFDLPYKKLSGNKVKLLNTNIHFNEDGPLSLDLT